MFAQCKTIFSDYIPFALQASAIPKEAPPGCSIKALPVWNQLEKDVFTTSFSKTLELRFD
ncbi:MAG: hypothetical protein CVV06_05065 [Gammaproteobacteria bacterium HGW-Gammaproteobacteria-10]|nr:MAG: hypothetical protein CVV06_05065 [Gammaproteobacteria bacterium HGW-Gammaproteobacteria-10]